MKNNNKTLFIILCRKIVCGKKKCVYVKKNSKSKKQFIKCKGIFLRLTYYIKEKTKKLKLKKLKIKKRKYGGKLKWFGLTPQQKKNQFKHLILYINYNHGLSAAVNGKELIDMGSEPVEFRKTLAQLNGIDLRYARYYLWDGKVYKPSSNSQQRDDSKLSSNIQQRDDPKSEPPTSSNIPPSNPQQRDEPNASYSPGVSERKSVSRPSFQTCENRRIFKRVVDDENGRRIEQYEGCPATKENCSEILKDHRTGKPKIPPPPFESYFYVDSLDRRGCYMRCKPPYKHMIKDDFKDASGQIVNICRQPLSRQPPSTQQQSTQQLSKIPGGRVYSKSKKSKK